jgi:hypothetical protein
MENTMEPEKSACLDQAMTQIKEEIKELKQREQYQKLKNDLEEITTRAVNTPNEFEGAMQVPDTERILKTKRKTNTFSELLLARIIAMCAFRPIIGNIIAILIAIVGMYYIWNVVDLKGFAEYRSYFSITIQIFAAIQIAKSASRSILLPGLSLILGSAGAHRLNAGGHHLLFGAGHTFYEGMIIAGIIGFGIAVLSID